MDGLISLLLLAQVLGMHCSENSGQVPGKATTHALLLSGAWIGGAKVMARAEFAKVKGGVLMKIFAKGEQPELAQLLVAAIN